MVDLVISGRPHPYRNVQSGHAKMLTITSRRVVVISFGNWEAMIIRLCIRIAAGELHEVCTGDFSGVRRAALLQLFHLL